jgi:hypothetical protein
MMGKLMHAAIANYSKWSWLKLEADSVGLKPIFKYASNLCSNFCNRFAGIELKQTQII